MGDNLSPRQLAARIAWVNKLQAEWDAERAKAALAEARGAIEAWNKHLASNTPTLLSPTIGAALATGHRWLTAGNSPARRPKSTVSAISG